MRNGKNSKLLIALILMVSMTMLSACTTFDSFRNTFIGGKKDNSNENVIRIGVFEPQTGRYADTGLSEIKGIELANSIYNSVDGYRIELVTVDTQSTTNAAETAIQGLIKMNPVAIIGSCGEATSLIASKYVDAVQIPTITPSATNPLITQNYRYYFRASITGSQMGEGVADYAYGYLRSRKIGVIAPANDTAATAFLDGFNDKIKKLIKGSKADSPVVLDEASDLEDENVNKVIKKIRQKGVNTLLMPFGAEKMDRFFTAIEKYNMTGISFIGTKAWGDSEFIDMMKNHPLIKIAFPYQSALSSSNATMTKEAERFQIEYANQYGSNDIPTENAALGYDSYLLMINAIHNAKSHEGPDIREALLNLKNVKCATGSFTFDEKGNTVRTVNISTIKDGKVITLHTTTDTTQAGDIEEIE